MAKKKDLKTMQVPELEKKLGELRMELMKANSQIAAGTIPKNPGQVRYTKKTIARIMTFIAQKNSQKKEDSEKTNE
jgi:large subunit ribosomal protein L29